MLKKQMDSEVSKDKRLREEVKELRHARQQLQARMLTYADVC
jgi:hypothetical protein